MNNLSLYGVKIIYTHLVNHTKRFYEESIVTVMASSFDEACQKAEKYAKASFDTYTNPKGETVQVTGFELLDCFLAYDAEDGVQEVYSMITKNKTLLSEDEYYKIITDQCTPDELYDLRNQELN